MSGAGAALALRTARTGELDEEQRSAVVRVCIEAHGEEDFRNLFSYLPPDGLHVLGHVGAELVGHAVVTTRRLRHGDLHVLRTAYVDAVATSPAHHGQGIGSAVMRHLAAAVADYDVACLETERVAFYERLGWEAWRGPLAGLTDEGVVPTPEQTGIMVLRLPRTPALDPDEPLTIDADGRIW